MKMVAHRINSIAELGKVPREFGAEIDIRAEGSRLILNHEPLPQGELLVDYLNEYRHGLLVLNIKEAGIEDEVLRLVRAQRIECYFLLDVEFPYIFKAANRGERAIALRYSEKESFDTVAGFAGLIDWIWVDTFTRLPLDGSVTQRLKPFKTCLVCPERWGRPQDIPLYRASMETLKFTPDAVMTSLKYAPLWK